MKEKLDELHIGEILYDVDVKKYTTFKVSSKVLAIVFPDSLENLVRLLGFLKEEKIKHKVIGNGSNLVFVSNVFDGVLIRLDHFKKKQILDEKVVVGAGYSLMRLALELSNEGYTGFEFATGIPGSVGGSLVNNAGAYNASMAEVVLSSKILTPDYEVVEYINEDLKFNYRSSILQYKNDYICLEVTFKLIKGDKKVIQEMIQNRREKRMISQPLEYPSAGSVFRNPEGNYAGKIIEDLGFKGKSWGGAMVSYKHANFIINTGGATGQDIKKLVMEIKEKVKKEYGIDLICEQEFVE